MTDRFDGQDADDARDDALAEGLDDAVEHLMSDREPSSSLSSEVAALLEIAAELRTLPSPAFKARLKAELVPSAPSYGPPLLTEADITARLAGLAGPPRLVAHDLHAAMHDLPEMAMRFLAPLGSATIVVSRYATATPVWERHPAGDELLYVLDGALDVTTLTADGPEHDHVAAGSLFICRRGLWHWPRPCGLTSVLSLTPGEDTEHVHGVDDPLRAGETIPSSQARIACDLPAAISGLTPITITRATTEAEANGAVRELGALEGRMLGVMRFAGETPWERHPDGDELLHVLDGEIDVTVLTDDGPVHVDVTAGSLFVCPRGLWHRQRPKTTATLLFATPTASTEASWEEDPR